ncbi:MAG: Tyrosine recombinase XerC [Flavobacteriales bacterium]|nr:Tyrosine recombinase XerC [Flavobacteriales bacterium]
MRNRKEIVQLEAYLRSRYTRETVDSYSFNINRFLQQHPNAKKYTYSHIEEYFKDLKLIGAEVQYRRVILASIKAYYNFLLINDIIRFHPCRSFFIGEKKPTGKNHGALLTREELELLFKLREERYQDLINRNIVIIGLLIYQGMTSAELINLTIDDIDFREGVIIRASKKLSKRKLELKTKQIIALQDYINLERPKLINTNTNKLLLTKTGVPMTVDGVHAFIKSMEGAFDKALNPAVIRNSVISHWLNVMKIPLEHVQIMAGHKYPSSTEKYIRKDTKEQREIVTKLHESIFSKNKKEVINLYR